jgi:putative membrane protein
MRLPLTGHFDSLSNTLFPDRLLAAIWRFKLYNFSLCARNDISMIASKPAKLSNSLRIRVHLRHFLYDLRMSFCDLIVAMEQVEFSPRPVVGAIVVVSGLAVSFLLWLLYVHQASADFAGRWMFLPALNALLNGLCAIALCVGLYFIKHHNMAAHRKSMLLAFAFSSVFLVSYIVNHALHGDTIFPGHGPVRTLYLSILASHIILSILALPMVLTTFFFSLTGRFAMHRRIARLTFPLWLYVSITGVVVFVFLKAYAYQTR